MFAILSLDFWREIQKSLFGKKVDVQKLDGFCSESFGNSTGDRVRNETKYWIFAHCALCHFVNFWGGWKKLSNKGYLGRLISVSFCRWFGNQIVVWCVQFLSVYVLLEEAEPPLRVYAMKTASCVCQAVPRFSRSIWGKWSCPFCLL